MDKEKRKTRVGGKEGEKREEREREGERLIYSTFFGIQRF